MQNPLANFWNRLSNQPRALREALLLLLTLLVGATLMPLLIWAAGRAALGPYANGGFLALWKDYFSGIASGSEANCIVLLAPYAIICALRLLRFGLRSAA